MDFDSLQDDSLANGEKPKGVTQPTSPGSFDSLEDDQDKYGSTGQQLGAATEGFARGLLSRPVVAGAESVLSHAGVPHLTPEEQAGRESGNPFLSGASEVGGFTLPAIASLGSSSLAKLGIEGAVPAIKAASKFTQAGVLGEFGEAVGKLSGLGGEGSSLISKIAASGVKTGAEMAALQASDEAAKVINQDPNQSLGTAAINIGLSGILGGAGGSVLGAVSPLWKAGVEKAGIPKLIDEAKAQYGFRQALPNGGDVPAAITDELNTRLSEVDNLRTQMSNLKGASLERAMPEVTPDNTAKIDSQIEDISNAMTNSIEKASDNAYLKGAVPKLAQDFQDFLEVVTKPESTYAQKFEAIDNLKRSQQAKGNYNLTAEDSALGKFTKGTARDLRIALEDPKVWGEAAVVQSKVNSAIKASIDAEKDAVGKFTAKSAVEGGRVVDPTKINTLVNQSLKGKAGLKTNVIHNYLENTQELADTINKIHTNAGLEAPIRISPTPALDHTLGRSSAGTTLGNWLFDKGLASVVGHSVADATGAGLGSLIGHPMLGAIAGERLLAPAFTSIAKPLLENASRSEAFKASLDYAVNVLRGERVLNQATENLFKSGAEIIPFKLMPNATSREALEKSLKYASNPDDSMKIGGEVAHYMPDHATAAAMTSANAVRYFASLKPKQIQNSPMDKPSPVDKFKQAQYNRQLDIAQQPLLVLQYAKKGTLQPQDVNTLNVVYPGLIKKIASKLQEQIVHTLAGGGHISYKQKASLSLLTGQPLVSTLMPQTMQAIMMANAPMVPPPQPAGKKKSVSQSTASTMSKTNKMYETPAQAREAEKLSG